MRCVLRLVLFSITLIFVYAVASGIVKAGPPIPQRHISWTFYVYNAPCFRAERVGTFEPTAIDVLRELDGWGLVATTPFEMWVYLTADRVYTHRRMGLFQSIGDIEPREIIAPQVVRVLARNGDWKQISTWMGPMWIYSNFRAPMIALTFDDGPSRYTSDILDILDAHNARATFFVLGNRVHANADIIQRAVTQGSDVLGHSWGHPRLTSLERSEIMWEIRGTSEAISQVTGTPVLPLFRPPYGLTNSRVMDIVREAGYASVMWSVDPQDWEVRSANHIHAHIMGRARNGQIILLHDIHPQTSVAMRLVVPELIEAGFDLVPVSELIEHFYGPISPGATYRGLR